MKPGIRGGARVVIVSGLRSFVSCGHRPVNCMDFHDIKNNVSSSFEPASQTLSGILHCPQSYESSSSVSLL